MKTLRLELGQQRLLAGVERADADQRDPPRLDGRQRILVALELRAGETERGRKRHPVDVSARRRLGPVQVAVRVEPEHAAGATGASHPAERAQRDRVIAAEHQR